MPQITPAQQPPVRSTLPHLKRIAADEQALVYQDNSAWRQAGEARGAGEKKALLNNSSFSPCCTSTPAPPARPTQQIEIVQPVAPEELRVVDISFYDKEYYAGDKLIATVTHDHDDFVTQRWVVVINNAEVFRALTPMICHRFICTHYKAGSLPKQEEDKEQGAGSRGEEFSPLHPAPCPPASSTGNEILVQIFDACEQHGLELLEDGIYQDDVKLGEVGFTDSQWWFTSAAQANQGRVICESVDEAVRMLLVEAVVYEELLDKAFDELTADEWLTVMESEPVRELMAA